MTDLQKLSLEEIEEELKANPQNIKLRVIYAERLIDEGFLQDAQDEYFDLIKIFPEDPELLFNLGVTYEKQNNIDEAIGAYQLAADMDPQDPDFRYNLGFMYDKKGEVETAIGHYKKTIELNPEDANAYFNIGYLYAQQNKNDLAIEYFEKAKKSNPDDIYARFDLAFEYKKRGEIERALEEYFELVEISPGYSWAYFNIGCIFFENGEKEQAIEFFKKTIEANPKDIEVYKILSDIALTPEETLEYLNIGLRENPDNGELHYYISQVYKKMRNNKEQLFHLEKAVQNKESLFVNPLLVSEEIRKLRLNTG